MRERESALNQDRVVESESAHAAALWSSSSLCSSNNVPSAAACTAVGGIGETELAYGGNVELSTDMSAVFRTR